MAGELTGGFMAFLHGMITGPRRAGHLRARYLQNSLRRKAGPLGVIAGLTGESRMHYGGRREERHDRGTLLADRLDRIALVIKLRAIKLARCGGCKQKRMGPGALEHRGARHLRLCEGFLVHTSTVSESDSAWPLRSSPVNVFEFSKAQ
jgi:hypothetical protein